MRRRVVRRRLESATLPPTERYPENRENDCIPAADKLGAHVGAEGERCVNCGGEVEPEDQEQGLREIIVWSRCRDCELTVRQVFRLVETL
jgi:hypothetical protein